ncbi:MAG: 1-deoxy-D-xylulose-5-phosphate synthase [Chloroflexi bacterium]|nr:1-deoxy-D-xylulose-5-phosphate synthase [Chloroflexota bacterium]
MWIERKGNGLVGPARIGRVTFSKSGASLFYGGRTFQSLKGQGFKTNFRDVESGEEYWISGCHRDGNDALYSTTVEVDEDVLEEYWVTIRRRPDLKHVRRFYAPGKY